MKKYLSLSAVILAVALLSLIVPSNAPIHAQGQYAECLSAAASPGCQNSAYGIAVIAAASQQVVVNTAAATANAIILLTADASTVTGTSLGVTCNVTTQPVFISARVVGSSFTIRAATGTFTTNPGCVQWRIINQ